MFLVREIRDINRTKSEINNKNNNNNGRLVLHIASNSILEEPVQCGRLNNIHAPGVH
jgi:hypothetical protein